MAENLTDLVVESHTDLEVAPAHHPEPICFETEAEIDHQEENVDELPPLIVGIRIVETVLPAVDQEHQFEETVHRSETTGEQDRDLQSVQDHLNDGSLHVETMIADKDRH